LDIGYHKPGSGNLGEKREGCKRMFEITVFGEGADGHINLSEEVVDFGAVKISEHRKIIVKICNSSDCTFYVDTSIKNALPDSKIT
jgi:hypothetical protein